MENKKVIGIFAFSLVLILGVSLASAYGFGSKMSSENHEEIQLALENNDYDSWKEIMQSQINEDVFNQAKSRYLEREEYRTLIQEARENQDFEKIQELKSEFGMGKRMHRTNMNSEDCPFAN